VSAEQVPDRGLSPRECATLSGFGYAAILREIRRGRLVAYEPVEGRYRVRPDDFRAWFTAHPVPTDSERPQRARKPPRRSPRRPAASGSVADIRAIRGGA
jgi:hypothetical protein